MQLLFEFSEEGGGAKGLGLIEGKVGKFPESTPKIPHIGFNEARPSEHSKLFADLQHLDFYFVHSYRVVDVPEKVDSFSICSYGGDFIASIEYQNIFGTQFHPEKSQKNGLKLLKNFLSLK
jgi:glutamine amidotransferase